MDPALLGTWELEPEKTAGLEEFGKAMGFDDDKIEAYSKMSYTFTLSLEGDTYNIFVDFKGDIPDMGYGIKVGETIDYTGPDGNEAKLTLTLEGTNPVETYEIPDKNRKWTIKRSVREDELTAVASVGPVSMTLYFSRL